MKTANTFWKIIFLLLSFSNLGLTPQSENRDKLMALSFIHFAVPFYQSKQQREFTPKYFAAAILAKVYHNEAVSFLLRDGKRFMANRSQEPEKGMSRVLFFGMMSTLILTEAIFNFIFPHLKVKDLKNEWFKQYQF